MLHQKAFIKKLDEAKDLATFLEEVKGMSPRCFFLGQCMLTSDLLSDLNNFDIHYTITGYTKCKAGVVVDLDGGQSILFRY